MRSPEHQKLELGLALRVFEEWTCWTERAEVERRSKKVESRGERGRGCEERTGECEASEQLLFPSLLTRSDTPFAPKRTGLTATAEYRSRLSTLALAECAQLSSTLSPRRRPPNAPQGRSMKRATSPHATLPPTRRPYDSYRATAPRASGSGSRPPASTSSHGRTAGTSPATGPGNAVGLTGAKRDAGRREDGGEEEDLVGELGRREGCGQRRGFALRCVPCGWAT